MVTSSQPAPPDFRETAARRYPLTPMLLDRLEEALTSKDRVEGLTHNFYLYPARSSPRFVQQPFQTPLDKPVPPFPYSRLRRRERSGHHRVRLVRLRQAGTIQALCANA